MEEVTYPTTVVESKSHNFNFWKHKPVSKFTDIVHSSDIIDKNIETRKNYSQNDPLKLPQIMEWKELDLNDINSLNKVCKFINEYESVGTKKKFKIRYTSELLKLALYPHGSILTISLKKNGEIYGVIGYCNNDVTVFDKTNNFGICHFLCVHPMYRNKKMVSILIDEMTRRLIKKDIISGCYVTNRCVPAPIVAIRQYRRPINYEKLHKLRFCALQEKCTEKDINNFVVATDIPKNYINMTSEHIPDAYKLLNEFMMRFNVYVNYSKSELKELLLNNKIVKSYVILDKEKNIIDFISYYDIEYECVDTDETINARYFYLHTCVNIGQDSLINESLKIAQQDSIDLITTTDTMLMSNAILSKEFSITNESEENDHTKIYEYKFVRSENKAYFNLFNWKCPEIKPVQLSWFPFNF